MTAEMFRQIFGSMSDPVLLKDGDTWHVNDAAQALCLSEVELDQLAQWESDAFVWLGQRFYHVSSQPMEGRRLYWLHPDVFLEESAANVASQLRQRLQSAFGCVSDLSQIEGLRTDLRARERLCGVNRELYQLLRMAEQLEFSGQPSFFLYRPECFDLAAAMADLADELSELLAPAKVTLKTDFPSSLVLTADWERLKYSILSLVSNAMAHLPEDDPWVSLALKAQKGQAILTVADNGSGFSPDILSHPLWSEPRRLLYGRGLGLGLPLVQRIASLHSGTVMVFPSPTGSRVTVSLPIQTRPDILAEPGISLRNPSGFSMAKILLSNVLPRSVYFPDPDGDD